MARKLNLERLLNQTGYSLDELAKEVHVSAEKIQACAEGKEQLDIDELESINYFTGIPVKSMYIAEDENMASTTNAIRPDDAFEESVNVKLSLQEYIEKGLQQFKDDEIRTELEKISKLVKALRKPKIAFSGYSDAGKSTLINALLGTDKLPAKWTPTTSIVVHIKHIDDRPKFMHEDVWIFKKDSSQSWDDRKLDDEKYCKSYLIKKGGYALLQEFGTHQGKRKGLQKADSAVVFIDSPLLKNCDILDVPGFGANKEDDEKQKSQMMNSTGDMESQIDILIYLSRANGFMTDNDMNFLKQAISRLRPIEQLSTEDVQIAPLANLFVLASQADAVENGNAMALNGILDTKCGELCKMYRIAAEAGNSLLPSRTAVTKHDYTEADFRARFFTYEKSMKRLCKKFNEDFRKLSEYLPKVIYADFEEKLKKTIVHSTEHLTAIMNQYDAMLKERQSYQSELREMRAKEPNRKLEQTVKREEMFNLIDRLNRESKTEIEKSCSEVLNIEYLVNLMETKEIQNKKEDKQSFSAGINELLNNKISEILKRKSEKYAEAIQSYLKQYQEALFPSEKISVEFDVEHAFAMGMAGLGAVGAGGAWLALALEPMMVAFFGLEAGFAAVAAVLGVIGIVIGGIVLGVMAIFKASKWKKKFAESIIKSYEKNNFLDAVLKNIDKYWKDTEISFKEGSENLEKEAQKKMKELEALADEKNIPELQKKLQMTQNVLKFFEDIPMFSERKMLLEVAMS